MTQDILWLAATLAPSLRAKTHKLSLWNSSHIGKYVIVP